MELRAKAVKNDKRVKRVKNKVYRTIQKRKGRLGSRWITAESTKREGRAEAKGA